MRYLKVGNQTGTILALCNLVDFNLKKEHVQIAIMDAGGLEVIQMTYLPIALMRPIPTLSDQPTQCG